LGLLPQGECVRSTIGGTPLLQALNSTVERITIRTLYICKPYSSYPQ